MRGRQDVFNLKRLFRVTGVDLSPAMLAQAQERNPECNVYDPDPTDESYETTILYLIRDQGRLRMETDHGTLGLFSRDTGRRVLREADLEGHEGRYAAGGDEYTGFAGVKTT